MNVLLSGFEFKVRRSAESVRYLYRWRRPSIPACIPRLEPADAVCAQKNGQGVFCKRGRANGQRARRGHAAPQELLQFRKATTMIAVEGNRLHALKIRRTTRNAEEELVNAPAGQKLFCSLLS